jgi:hypothetical protein
MVKNIFQSRWVLGFLLLCAAQTQAGIFNEQPKNLIDERSYGSVFLSSCDINGSGDFGGNLTLIPALGTDPQELNLVPHVKRGIGGGAMVGYRSGLYAVEVSYWRSNNNVEYYQAGTTYGSTAVYQAVNVDLKRYFFPRIFAQPFISGGFTFPWLDVKDASYPYNLPNTSLVGHASYSGWGFNLTGGMEIYLNSNFSVFGGIQERWDSFGSVKGYTRTSADVKNSDGTKFSLQGNGVNFIAGLTACFF